MQTEETKDNGTKGESTDFGCCGPENFQKMFEKMSKCCPGQGDAPDFSAMKGAMIKNMMGMCCAPKTTDTKGETESTEKDGCCS